MPQPNPRRIALCLEYPLGQAGGVSMLVRELVAGLARDYEIVLVSPDTAQVFETDPIKSRVAEHLNFDTRLSSQQAARALATRIAEAKVSLAHFHFGGNFAWNNRFPARCPIPHVARFGIPVVTTIHMAIGWLHGYCGPRKPLWFKLGLLPVAWMNKLRVLRHVQCEITVSKQDCRRLRGWYWPLGSRFKQIYHSRLHAPDTAVPAPQREPIILAVGHIAQRKGQLVLAEAFTRIAERYPEWRLLLAGHASEASVQKQIEELARRSARPDRISLLGRQDDTASLMQRASLYVQPSFHEGLPLALQEALYYQCACVATRISGNTELVEDQTNGLLVPPGNVEEMAWALEKLIDDPAARERLAMNARTSILQKEMTAERMLEKHRNVYQRLLH